MKTRNFPAKKDARRRRALERGLPEKDAKNTIAKLQSNPRNIRTKKQRGRA